MIVALIMTGASTMSLPRHCAYVISVNTRARAAKEMCAHNKRPQL